MRQVSQARDANAHNVTFLPSTNDLGSLHMEHVKRRLREGGDDPRYHTSEVGDAQQQPCTYTLWDERSGT